MEAKFIQDRFDEGEFGKLHALYESGAESFYVLVEILGLDPQSDFKHSDLSGVDFTGSDLTDYSFENSDLRGAIGTSVVFPSLEALSGADVEGSIFALKLTLENLRIPNTRKFPITVIDESDPLTSSVWIIENMQEASPRRVEAVVACLENLKVNDNSTIVSGIIYAAKRFFSDRKQFREFLLGTLAEKIEGTRAVVACLNMLSSGFATHPQTKDVLLSFLRTDDRVEVIGASIRGLAKLDMSDSEIGEVSSLIRSSQFAGIRRYLMSLAISKVGGNLRYFSGRPGRVGDVLDIAEPIGLERFRLLYGGAENKLTLQHRINSQYGGRAGDVPSVASKMGLGGPIRRSDLHEEVLAVLKSDMEYLEQEIGMKFELKPEVRELIL